MGDISFTDCEIASGIKGSYRSTNQKRAQYPVDKQHRAVGGFTVNITWFGLKFIRNCLNNKSKEDNNPYPVSTPETG